MDVFLYLFMIANIYVYFFDGQPPIIFNPSFLFSSASNIRILFPNPHTVCIIYWTAVSIYSRPPVSGIGLFRLPVHLQALRQAPCPKMYAKPERTNGTHSPVLSLGASPTCETFRAPSRSNKFPDVCPGSPLLSYPFLQPLFSSLGFAVTERITLCLRNFPPVSATAIARPSAKAG